MAWAKLNDVEVSSREKAKTFGSWKYVFVGTDDGREEWFLFVNTLKGRILKMGENQHENFGNSWAEELENSDDDGKGLDDIKRNKRQQLKYSPNLFETKVCWDMFQIGYTIWSDTIKGSKGLYVDRSWRQKRCICFTWEDCTSNHSKGRID